MTFVLPLRRFGFRVGLSACLLATATGFAATVQQQRQRGGETRPDAKSAVPPTRPMTLQEARTAVAMLDDAYRLILHEVHRTYHTQPGRPVAATVVRDLQKVMTEKGWPQSHFLAVNAIVMNPDHLARTPFEHAAVRAIEKSDQPFERIEHGKLELAAPMSLNGECFSCHWSKDASLAAIHYTVPLKSIAARKNATPLKNSEAPAKNSE